MRHFPDWLEAYLAYSANTEPPAHLRFWAGVSAVAGCLQRKVWIDRDKDTWYPNFFIIIVGPPGVVQKSTTINTAYSLLKQIKGVRFGPSVITPQRLVEKLGESKDSFLFRNMYKAQCAMTIKASELGTLIDPQDRVGLDYLTDLWDNPDLFDKETKGSGNDKITNAWLNMIGGTTPAWIAGNFPQYAIGSGFTSRCLFVYSDRKARLVPHPELEKMEGAEEQRAKLVADLQEINKLTGPFQKTKAAYDLESAWYEDHNRNPPQLLVGEQFGGYLSRKQAHVSKLAMVLSASTREDRVIDRKEWADALLMVSGLEEQMLQVFAQIGQSEQTLHMNRLLAFVKAIGRVKWEEAYLKVHAHFPSLRAFEDCLLGMQRSLKIKMIQEGSAIWIVPGPAA